GPPVGVDPHLAGEGRRTVELEPARPWIDRARRDGQLDHGGCLLRARTGLPCTGADHHGCQPADPSCSPTHFNLLAIFALISRSPSSRSPSRTRVRSWSARRLALSARSRAISCSSSARVICFAGLGPLRVTFTLRSTCEVPSQHGASGSPSQQVVDSVASMIV